jgi:hypothetical protein
VRSKAWICIDAQYQRVFGRIEIEPHHVAHLLDKERVGGKLEALGAMGLEPEQREVARHRALGDAGVRRHTAHAPMGRVGRPAVEHLAHQRRQLLIIIGSRPSRTQFPVQPGKPAFAPAASPMADGRNADPAARGDHLIGYALSRHQYDPRASHQRVRQTARARNCSQLFNLSRTDYHRHVGPAHEAS